MRRRRLTILAAISLAGLVVLLCGYFSFAMVGLDRYTATTGGVRVLDIVICLDRGRAHIDWGTYPPGRATAHGWWIKRAFFFARPEAHRSLWNFYAMTLSFPQYYRRHAGCPIWCLALPCTIAPVLWLWQRRKRETRGFAVEPSGFVRPGEKA